MNPENVMNVKDDQDGFQGHYRSQGVEEAGGLLGES
jgi:hypothetical protein